MTESPDTPWAKNHDTRIKKKFDEPPSEAALFFHDFLKAAGVGGGRFIDIGCGNGRNAIYFAHQGFEVHAVDKSDEFLKDMDLHGVMPHCHSVTDYWFFEDSFFDLALDMFCYSELADEERKSIYRSELSRVLKPGGYYFLCVPEGFLSRAGVEKELPGYAVLFETSFEDKINGKKKKAVGFILRKL
ncbi:MAG: class I SAM-dependent methyltransferase [Candidatus Micrarchaeota archaeon]